MANHNGAGANGAGHNGHHGPREGLYVPFTTQSDVVQDLIGKHDKPSDKWWSGVAAGGILLLLGLIGFAIRMTDGVSDRVVWGYFAMMFAFVLTTAQAAPMVAIAPRIANSHWRRPISARGGDVDGSRAVQHASVHPDAVDTAAADGRSALALVLGRG